MAVGFAGRLFACELTCAYPDGIAAASAVESGERLWLGGGGTEDLLLKCRSDPGGGRPGVPAYLAALVATVCGNGGGMQGLRTSCYRVTL